MFLGSGRWALGVGPSAFSVRVSVLYLRQLSRQLDVTRSCAQAFLAGLTIIFAHVIRHFVQRGSGEENLIHALTLHRLGVGMRDRSAAAAENFNVVGTLFAQLFHYVGKKFDVSAVVTGNADRTHVLLDGGARDVANRPVIAEIDDFNAVPDELEIDCVDRAVVSVTDRHGGEDANR